MRELLTSCLSLSDKFSKEDENVEGVEEDDIRVTKVQFSSVHPPFCLNHELNHLNFA